MRARVRYLTGLARHTAGQLPLRPPGRIFASDVYAPTRSADRPAFRPRTGPGVTDVVDHPVSSPRVAEEAPPSREARPAPGADTGPGRPDIPTPTSAAPSTPAAAASDFSATPAAPAPATVAERVGPPAANPAPPAARATTKRAAVVPQPPVPPVPPASPGAEDVSLPAVRDLTVAKSVTALPDPPRADTPAAKPPPPVAASGASPVGATSSTSRELPTQPEPKTGVEAPQAWPPGFDFLGKPVELPQPSGSATAVDANPLDDRTSPPADRPQDDHIAPRTAIHDLLPVPRPVVEQPGGSRRHPGAAAGARVSIGTIEVTVVPPPAPAVRDVATPAQTARSRPRAGSALAVRPGSDRLRDGLRRWYGTAQG